MNAPDRSAARRTLARRGLAAAFLVLLLPTACKDEPPSAPVRHQSLAAEPTPQSVSPAVAAAAYGTDLLLPLSDDVVSTVPGFEIKQGGGGIAGRFEITNPFSSGIALDGVTNGSGHALLAWNLGLGRAAVLIQTNSANTFPAVDVSTQGLNSGLEVSINNSANADSALLADTRGTGPAGSFLVLNTSSNAPALTASTVGSGHAGRFTGRATATNVSALSVIQTGRGRGLHVNHTGSEGNLAVFQTGGSNKARINRFGKGYFNGGTQSSGADVAEAFAVEGRTRDYEPGDVLVISTRSDRTVERSAEPYSTLVAGVHATKPGVLLTERHIDESLDDLVPMGVVGVIPTKVSAENGPIARGDLLVTAATPGHAMRAAPVVVNGVALYPTGAVLGKAVEPFAGPGTGVIRVLVNVQ